MQVLKICGGIVNIGTVIFTGKLWQVSLFSNLESRAHILKLKPPKDMLQLEGVRFKT